MDVNQAIDQANQTNSTILWVLFAVVVVAPILVLFVAVFVKIMIARGNKCPKCGNWKLNKPASQTVRTIEGRKATVTTKRIIICAKCGTEFSV